MKKNVTYPCSVYVGMDRELKVSLDKLAAAQGMTAGEFLREKAERLVAEDEAQCREG